MAKSIAHAHRLELLEQLGQGERSVEVLASRTGLSVANASQHLQQMRRGGLVVARRDGKFMLYQLSDNSVLDLVAALQTIAEQHLAEVDRIVRSYFRDRDNLEAVSRKELMRRLKDGLVTVLDVRPEDEYALGHLPGAINIPLKALTASSRNSTGRARLSPTAVALIAFCHSRRSRRCVHAALRLAVLRMVEWRAAGLPVETGQAVQ